MNINSNILKITGGAELSGEIDPKKEAQITGTLSVYSVEYRDKQDGTYDRVYKAKFIGEIGIESGANKLKGSPKMSESKKLRQAIWHISESDDFYPLFMGKLIGNLEETWEFLKDK